MCEAIHVNPFAGAAGTRLALLLSWDWLQSTSPRVRLEFQKRSVLLFLKVFDYSELSLFRSPMGLPHVAGISRWPHFRVPRDARGYIRDSVTCIFSSMQGHCDWLVAS